MPTTVLGANHFQFRKTRSSFATTDSDYYCLSKKCKDSVTEGDQAIQCSNCCGFSHIRCVDGFTSELYTAINNAPDNPLISLCEYCQVEHKTKQAPINEKLNKISTAMQSNSKNIEIITKKLADLKSNLSVSPPAFPDFREIQRLQKEADVERAEIEKRKLSCVIFNLEEEVDSFLPKLVAELGIDSTDITSSKLITTAKRANKPLLLNVFSESIKWHIVGKIRTKFPSTKIFAKPDYTPKQAAVEKELFKKSPCTES